MFLRLFRGMVIVVSSWLQVTCKIGNPISGLLASLLNFLAALKEPRNVGALAGPEKFTDSPVASRGLAAPAGDRTAVVLYPFSTRGMALVRGRRAPRFTTSTIDRSNATTSFEFGSASPSWR
jgi:hypothetical protein